MSYVTRRQAVADYGGGDPDVDESHIFQGDIYHSVEFRVPWKDDSVQGFGVVLSHDCEYTKAKKQPANVALSIAPARLLANVDKEQRKPIQDNRLRAFLYLPGDQPLGDEYAIDLRLTQPILAPQLVDYMFITCMGEELRGALQTKIAEHFTRRVLK